MSGRSVSSAFLSLLIAGVIGGSSSERSPKYPTAQEQLPRYDVWERFVGITTLDATLPWLDHSQWLNKCDLNLGPPACKSTNVDPQLLGQQPQLSNKGLAKGAALAVGLRAASVFYDAQYAAPFIKNASCNAVESKASCQCTGELGNSDTLDCFAKARHAILAMPGTPEPDIDFPPNSIAIKAIWEVLLDDRGQIKVSADANNSNVPRKQVNGDFIQQPVESWPSAGTGAMVDISNSSCDDRDYAAADKIPLGCFYSIAYKGTEPDVSNLKSGSEGNAINHYGIVAGRPFHLVLVGLHMAIKDRPEWTWATFWWTLKRNSPPTGRPSTPRQKHFAWDVTQSAELTNGLPQSCYNPYLELAHTNGNLSNCLYCHRRAVYVPGARPGSSTTALGFLRAASFGVKAPATDTIDFHGGVRTGFLWSVADHQFADTDNTFKQTIRGIKIP
jgi:hypothetical protein